MLWLIWVNKFNCRWTLPHFDYFVNGKSFIYLPWCG